MALETRNQVDAAEVYSRLGRTEGEVSQMNARLDRMDKIFDQIDDRLDRMEAAQARLLYWILGIGGVTLASVWVGNLTG